MRGKRLTAGKVKEIREFKSQGYPYRQIAKKLGVSLSAIAEHTRDIQPPAPTSEASTPMATITYEITEVPTPKVILSPKKKPKETPKETADEQLERYEQRDHFQEEMLYYYREWLRLLNEFKFNEAQHAFAKSKEAQRKFDNTFT